MSSGESLYVPVTVTLELAWVLRSSSMTVRDVGLAFRLTDGPGLWRKARGSADQTEVGETTYWREDAFCLWAPCLRPLTRETNSRARRSSQSVN
jgi:hypothetical protein